MLRVTEIFYSLQGETSRAGWPTVFIRLTGCPLRCGYCDSEYAFHGGVGMPVAEILQAVQEYDCPLVCVTGGEPLAQPACRPLLAALCAAGYAVSLETSGAIDIAGVDPRVARVVDLKAPGSGEFARNFWPNIERLVANDEVKFVLSDRADYEWARQLIAEQRLSERCPILFSPVADELPAATLADWIVADRLPVRLQIQLHKLLWGNMRGR